MRSFGARVEQQAPSALPTPESLDLPERLGYRVKNRLLGPPLVTERLRFERLGKPTALAVLSSDPISSSAYATEQILTVLIPVVGVAAFSLVVPITLAVLVVLAFVTFSYREVIRAYPKAGGAYVVSRENFGPNVAQIAAAALLIDYTLTVAVSVAAGVAALVSIAPNTLSRYTIPMSVAAVAALAFGNLRGVREAGRTFAIPTFFFLANMGLMLIVGFVRHLLGDLRVRSVHVSGALSLGHAGMGLFLGASLFKVLEAFANGGTTLTGTEAISNGVSVFRDPQSRNARVVLVSVAAILGTLVLGVSGMATFTHAIPYVRGTPTVLSQIGRTVYGNGELGSVLFYLLQTGTLFILVLAANTSFTGFPFLASFAAEDSFLPRQLTKRGHRLVFSNGILVLSGLSIALLVGTGAKVTSLIALYAIGVFTGFTMAGAGMVRHHLQMREEGWRRRVAINGSAAVVSLVVDIVFAVTKFTEGAWLVVVLLPLLVALFIRLNRQYRSESAQLEEGATQACEAPVLRRHVVLVLLDRIDLATAKAIQYARTLVPDDLRAVHIAIDGRRAQALEQQWGALALSRIDLEVVECSDRRLVRAVLELVAETLHDGETEVSVLLPRRLYPWGWDRLLHERNAERIAAAVGELDHATATIVPFRLSEGRLRRRLAAGRAGEAAGPEGGSPGRQGGRRAGVAPPTTADETETVPGTVPIGAVRWRQRAKVAGTVTRVRIQPWGSAPSLTCTLMDRTGGLTLVFVGRRQVAGIEPETKLWAEGTVGEHDGHLAIMNPIFELISRPAPDSQS